MSPTQIWPATFKRRWRCRMAPDRECCITALQAACPALPGPGRTCTPSQQLRRQCRGTVMMSRTSELVGADVESVAEFGRSPRPPLPFHH